MHSTPKTLASAGLIVGITLGGMTIPTHAVGSGGGGIPVTTARTVDAEAVELQRIRASVRSKGRVLKSVAPMLVTAEVPGEVTDVDKRNRLGLPTWRVVVEMESGYKVAAFVHRRTGVIIDWTVLKVPADVDYTPPKKDTKRPDPLNPKPAPVPTIVEDALDAERQAARPDSVAPAAADPTPASEPSDARDSDDDSWDDHSDDSRDESHGSSDDHAGGEVRDDSRHDSGDDDSRGNDSRDDDSQDESDDRHSEDDHSEGDRSYNDDDDD